MSPPGRKITWWRVAALVAMIAVPITGSRAGLLALVVVAVLMVPPGRVRTVAVVAAIALATGVVTVRFVTAPDVLAWHRPQIWRAVAATWVDRPLTGVSPGALADAVRPHRPEHRDFVGRRQMVPAYAESTPLAVLVQTGVVGLVLFAAALWLAVRDGRRSRTAVSRPAVAALSSAGTIALFHDLLTADPVLWWWAALAGATWAIGVPTSTPVETPTGARRQWLGAAAAGWLVLWGLVQPTVARTRYLEAPPTTATVEGWQRAEPWDDAPLRRRLSVLLGLPRWTWPQAAEALSMASRAVTIHRGSAVAWGDLGRVRARIATELGDQASVAEARHALERSGRLDPWVPWTWLEWARLERAAGRTDTASALVARALEAEPATVRAWLFQARLELDRGRPEAARQAFDTVVELVSRRGDPNLSPYEHQLLAADPAELAAIEGSL